MAAVSLATLVSSFLSDRERERLMLLSSTNLHGLAAHPLAVLVASVFWSTPAGLATFVGPAAVVLGLVEWRVGSLRTLTVAASGHVGGTLLTASGIASGITLGTLPAAAAGAIDVGASYAIMAVMGFATVLVAGRARALAGAAIFGWVGIGVLLDRDFTAFGHLFAAVIGLCLALGGLGLASRSRSRLAISIFATLVAVAPLTGYVDLYPTHRRALTHEPRATVRPVFTRPVALLLRPDRRSAPAVAAGTVARSGRTTS